MEKCFSSYTHMNMKLNKSIDWSETTKTGDSLASAENHKFAFPLPQACKTTLSTSKTSFWPGLAKAGRENGGEGGGPGQDDAVGGGVQQGGDEGRGGGAGWCRGRSFWSWPAHSQERNYARLRSENIPNLAFYNLKIGTIYLFRNSLVWGGWHCRKLQKSWRPLEGEQLLDKDFCQLEFEISIFDLSQVDRCCRAHDHCPVKVKAFRSRYGLQNFRCFPLVG